MKALLLSTGAAKINTEWMFLEAALTQLTKSPLVMTAECTGAQLSKECNQCGAWAVHYTPHLCVMFFEWSGVVSITLCLQ